MRIRSVAAIAALVFVPSLARAQQARPIEFGIDAGVSTSTDNFDSPTIAIPIRSLRVGFHVADKVAIEPALMFQYSKFGDVSSSFLKTDLGLVYAFTPSRTVPQVYIRPFVGVANAWVKGPIGGDTPAVWNAGGGIGVKLPIKSVDRLGWRIEALYDHTFEASNDDIRIYGSDALGLRVGLSFFTR